MGIFNTIKEGVSVGLRINKDKQGTYWQRIDEVNEAKTPKTNDDFIQVNKTVVRTLVGVLQPGDDTSHAFFRDKFNYLERDLKRLCQAALDLTSDEANALTAEKLREIMITNGMLNGLVVEVTVREVPTKKDPEKTYAQVSYKRNVPVEELKAKLSDEEIQSFFPEGL